MRNKKETKLETNPVTPAEQPRKPMEVARSEPMSLRHMRFLGSSLYVTVANLSIQKAEPNKPLATATDTAAEYNWLLKTIDDFYAKARTGVGEVKIRLVAEAGGFTKEMEVFIQEKSETGGWQHADRVWKSEPATKVSLAK